ncbi:lycopene beta-cyclase CrtY [uncultured Algimonas sp.]|uniref:lycopene beta-cyclase CrtY n=1 Tax=uncultured Algimonas sp. TaxID=1547920 RepID=UPI0026103F26|nr:lycopene beta-cyclase CrtY [uncultured Algimonas sp.]
MEPQAESREESLADLVISGAGLSGLVTAWRCLSVNPGLIIDLYEISDRIAGDHTWSFNATDIAPELRDWFAPFVAHRWPDYEVRFPDRRRVLPIGYRSGNSVTLRNAVAPFIAAGRLRVHLGRTKPDDAAPHIDATGFALRDDEFAGWQKFVGHVIRTDEPHGVKRPVIMDATVEQIDGYRFMYLLPFSDRDLLVEDTYFSDDPHLSENAIGDRIERYIAGKGWNDYKTVRREKGVLPMMMATDRRDDSAKIGLGGGFAVAATGFTVPHAVEVADVIAQAILRNGPSAVPGAVADFRAHHLRRETYARLLNRMFFRAADPSRRYVVLQRFYGLGEGLIRRFYRNGLTARDKARILIGKPPVPVSRALANFSEKAFIRRERAKGPPS